MYFHILKWNVKWAKQNTFDIIFFPFNRGILATEAAREMCAVYEEGALPQIKAFSRLRHFKNEKFSTEVLATF